MLWLENNNYEWPKIYFFADNYLLSIRGYSVSYNIVDNSVEYCFEFNQNNLQSRWNILSADFLLSNVNLVEINENEEPRINVPRW